MEIVGFMRCMFFFLPDCEPLKGRSVFIDHTIPIVNKTSVMKLTQISI